MAFRKPLYITLLVILRFCAGGFAQQEYSIKGRVTELGTNEGMPYVNVYFKGTFSGTTTDFDGYYHINATVPVDSLTARYLGYKTRTKKLHKTDKLQVVDFQMEKDSKVLNSVVILPGVNPALRIVQNAIDSKKKYDKTSLENIHYRSYTKTEADIDKMTKKIRKWKMFRPLVTMYDSMDVLAGESKANLPVYFSEVTSQIYYQKSPQKKRENVEGIRINFVGKKDGSAASQLTGSDFDNYNFYDENVDILKKPFISPLSDKAMTFYHYYLIDSLWLGNSWCYKINVMPKNVHDAAFKGFMWITDTTWVARQFDLEIPKEANFDLVERVHIQQELVATGAGPWMPSRTRILIDYIDLTEDFVSMVLKIYQSSDQYVVNQPAPPEFFDRRTNFAEDALLKKDTYWDSIRPEHLSPLEAMNYRVIDTVRAIPFIKHGVNTLYFLAMGYVTAGPVDFGHYINVYSHNSYEGDRWRLGFRTNSKLSKEWVFRGYGAYGVRDEKFKYNLQLERIVARFPWTKVGAEYRDDIDRVGSTFDYASGQMVGNANNVLYATGYVFGDLRQFVRKNEARAWYESEFKQGLTQRFTLQNIKTFPLYPFTFGNDPFAIFQQRNYSITELLLDTRFAPGELFIQNGNERMQVGSSKKPVFNLNVTLGIKDLFGSDFEYQKVSLSATQHLKWGILGITTYDIRVGKVFSAVPYTLLEVHRGNETLFFSSSAFNQMNYSEFVSDQFAEVHLQHYFMGLIFNRVPLIKKWNLREVLSCNAVYGSLSSNNLDFNRNNQFMVLNKMPYVELGAGITNILDIFRVDYIYRATYIDSNYIQQYQQLNPGNKIHPWGIKVSLQFML